MNRRVSQALSANAAPTKATAMIILICKPITQPGGAGTKKKLTAEDAEDAEDAEEKTLIQCFETSAFLCVLRG